MPTKKSITEILKKDFPPEALSADSSRGFTLTSIKAAFVIERLNDVFGLCGTGWKYEFTNFKEPKNGEGEIGVKVTLHYQKEDGEWSEPISHIGGKKIVRGNLTDARKSAITDGLTKIASMLGIGHKVFKGLETPPIGEGVAKVSQESQKESEGDLSLTCPHCGVKLVHKKSATYDFWGCPNYPECKYTWNPKKDSINKREVK